MEREQNAGCGGGEIEEGKKILSIVWDFWESQDLNLGLLILDSVLHSPGHRVFSGHFWAQLSIFHCKPLRNSERGSKHASYLLFKCLNMPYLFFGLDRPVKK